MIPTHVLTGLKPDAARALAARRGSEVLATHLRDHAAIRAPVASREQVVARFSFGLALWVTWAAALP